MNASKIVDRLLEADEPPPEELLQSIPDRDYVLGILKADDPDAEEGAAPAAININAVPYLKTKSQRWLKQLQAHIIYGGSPGVSFTADPDEAQPWTYAVLMNAPVELVNYLKERDCDLDLQMDLDQLGEWLKKRLP